MKRTPVRAAYAAATLATSAALSLAQPALAHVDVQPRLVEQGAEAVLRIELPQLRAGPAPAELLVEGDGVTFLSSSLVGAAGGETLWSVRLRIGPAVPAGDLLLVLRAVFAGGESIEVDGTVTVVPPARKEDTNEAGVLPWVGVVAVVGLVLALAAGALLLARRRGAW